MWVVAVRTVDADETTRVEALQAAFGITAYEARPRALPPVPRVVGTFGQREPADTAAAILGGAQMSPLVLGEDEMESDARRAFVRSFVLAPEGVRFALRDGRVVEVDGRQIRLLVRGTRIRTELHVETTTQRKLAVGKAVLTGGLLLTKQQKKEVTVSSEVREGFVYCYASGLPDLAILETSVQYGGLERAMAPTRAANFARLVTELRARAPGAPYDDRLLTRAGQAQVLGGVLGPEAFLDVATTVLSASLATKGASR